MALDDIKELVNWRVCSPENVIMVAILGCGRVGRLNCNGPGLDCIQWIWSHLLIVEVVAFGSLRSPECTISVEFILLRLEHVLSCSTSKKESQKAEDGCLVGCNHINFEFVLICFQFLWFDLFVICFVEQFSFVSFENVGLIIAL